MFGTASPCEKILLHSIQLFKLMAFAEGKNKEGNMFLGYRTRNTSVIRQKDEYQNESNKKTKQTKFFEKRSFLTP